MTDLKHSFASEITTTAEAATAPEENKKLKAPPPPVAEDVDVATSLPFVVKTPRANSKLILQNMEEVLNSVKKKHRQKHRRKKEQKRLAQMEADAAASEGREVTEVTNNGHKHSGKSQRKHHKKPLQEKAAQENGLNHSKSKQGIRKSPLKGVTTNGSILQHFSRTPKKDELPDPTSLTEPSPSQTDSQSEKPKKATNAFEVMMNARNKTIGSNTTGADAPASPVLSAEVRAENVKRKLLLQDWAERKGGAKRKLDEEVRAEFVEKKLEQRAKRLKRMLVKEDSPSVGSTRGRKNSKKTATPEKATVEKPKAKKGRPRAKRLTSVDSNELVVPTTPEPTPDPETEQFLVKLSSPTKKRDSLLGYFPKKQSPLQLLTKTDNVEERKTEDETVETPKRPPRRSALARKTATTVVTEGENVADAIKLPKEEVATTPGGRPRRTCAGKARYDYDLQESPTKNDKQAPNDATPKQEAPPRCSKTPKVTQVEINNFNDSSSSVATPTKLAPLFVRSAFKPQQPPPLVDAEALKARQQFLQSGVPEKMRLEQARQKQYEKRYEEAIHHFPKVPHVHQFSDNELEFMQAKKDITFKLRAIKEQTETMLPPSNSCRKAKGKASARLSITNCTSKQFRPTDKARAHVQPLVHQPLPCLENKRCIIKEWKAQFERFPTYKCYNQMREKYRYFSAIDSEQDTEQVTESFVVTRRTRRSLELQKKFDPDAPEEKPPTTAPNGELLYTEKYKPMLFEQFLVNVSHVSRLREFLANWSNGSNGPNLDNSMDFLNDSDSSQSAVCNTVVLLGPRSSGKTSAVFALANEMNFNVLEINAGMKRTGKKLIQELQEATQSHQIRKDSPLLLSGQSSSQKSLMKMSLNSLKAKKQSSQSTDDGDDLPAELGHSSRKSLLLIEDADIVFDQTDAGFTDAIHTLAASSKRPVIVVATNPNCPHLQRLMNANTIEFTAPNVLSISKYLAVLSLLENCPVHLDDLVSLYLYNSNDLRRTLLELQFFIQSGGDRLLNGPTEHQTTPQNKPLSTQDSHFFASPSKRRFSEEPNALQERDEQLGAVKQKRGAANGSKEVYTHRNLFEFYTVGQNENWRIPFPVDFRLLCINLNDVFRVADKLKGEHVAASAAITQAANSQATKRKSRSPKKAWLNSSGAKSQQQPSTSLTALCDFYENISIATLLGTRDENSFAIAAQTPPHFADRQVPHLTEYIAHDLVERAIGVNLSAAACPYNLFDTPKEKHSLCDYLGLLAIRSKRSRCLDYEATLRAVCRSEQARASQERRSTRFYHYLRNSSANNYCNFSTDSFDKAGRILMEERVVDIETAAET